MELKPYTYLIGWSQHNKYYYGVRYSKISDPIEIWVSYFTSSKYVKKFAQENGDPDIIQVRKIFDNREDSIAWETKVLKKMNVLESEIWLNKTTNRAIETKYSLHGWNKQSREKASNSHKGKIFSNTHKENLSKSLKGRSCYWLKGKKRPNHSEKMKGENNPRSISLLYENVVYGSIKELSEKKVISYYKVKKMLNNNEVVQIEIEKEIKQ